MSEKLSTHKVEVFKVGKVEDHPDAHSLELVEVWGYTCVVRKGQFVEGQLAAYVPPETILPNTEQFSFLWKGNAFPTERNRRIKASRLRGILSAGLVIDVDDNAVEGEDLWDTLGMVHYEPPISNKGMGGGIQKEVTGPPVPRGTTSYDVDSGFRYHHIIPDGTLVAITEKLHGCLVPRSLIRMADGSNRKISQINVGDEVLGVDEEGKVTTSMVTRKFDNGSTIDWLKISGSRVSAGRGNNYFSIVCTEGHMFFNPDTNNYTIAKDLLVRDKVISHRTEYQLTPIQKSVLIGKMLGDGSLRIVKQSASIVWGHTSSDKEYTEWSKHAIGDIGKDYSPTISGYGSTMYRAGTISCNEIKVEFDNWIINDRKTVPSNIHELLDPISLAFWYMDDGSLSHEETQEDRCTFATNSFTIEECELLQKGLKKFNIGSTLKNYGDGNRIFINSNNAERLFLLVAPYVPISMQRKLPERYRGHNGWIPNGNGQYKERLVELTIDNIEHVNDKSFKKMDLETETHNYFAHDILVHNSNSRFLFHNDQFYVGSRRQWSTEGENNWWRAAAKYPGIEEFCRLHPDWILYGEIYGNVQTLRYGKTQEDPICFAAFDIFNGNEFLSVRGKTSYLYGLGIPMVPLIKYSTYNFDEVQELVSGQSLIQGADHIREGIVVTPMEEMYDRRLGRVVLKFVSNEYLEGKDQ